MTQSTKIIKTTAKSALAGNFTKSIIASSIFVFAVAVIKMLCYFLQIYAGAVVGYIVYGILALLLILPLLLGLLRYFVRMIFSAQDKVLDIFYYFCEKSLYKRAMDYILPYLYRVFIKGLILEIPAIIFKIISLPEFYEKRGILMPSVAEDFSYISVFLSVVGFCVLFFITLKYYLSVFVFVTNENISGKQALKMSSVVSKRTTLDFLWLILSLLLYILVSVLVLPLIFTIPYFAVAYAVHSRFAVYEYNETVNKEIF